jgi:hypothetical protein
MSGLPMLVEPSETSLLGALAPLVARQPALVLGAGPGAHDGPAPALVVCVHGLQHTPRDAPGAERQSPQPADDARSWTIAGAQAHELAEVLAPDRVLVRGEDWSSQARFVYRALASMATTFNKSAHAWRKPKADGG